MKNGFLLVLVGVIVMVVASKRKPRGIRNNNPLNIRVGADWVGLAPIQDDKVFAQFVDYRYGYRAGARILSTYAARGVVFLGDIVGTWAPPSENDTGSYVDRVCQMTGWEKDKVIGPGDWVELLAAMTVVENGYNPYSLDDIREGVSWA